VDSKLPGVVLVEVSHDRRVAVTNYSGQAIEGHRFLAFAVQTGHYENGLLYLDLFDCGVPFVPPPPTPEQMERAKAAAKAEAKQKENRQRLAETTALKYNQELADKGDAYGQLRMGERYLKGEGVEKDLDKARRYLQMSADQGNGTARKLLEQLNETTATTP
jgi:TPR repeat protein